MTEVKANTAPARAKRIPKRVTRWVRSVMLDLLTERVHAGDWMGVLVLAESENRISLCMDLFTAQLVPEAEWPEVLARAISGGDDPCRERDRLCTVLARLHGEGRRVFDSEAARLTFADMPERVTIHRGTVDDETAEQEYGVCWTLDRDRAHWFATKHGRFRNTRSPPVLLTTAVDREDICGLLVDRNEKEVLVHPDRLWIVHSEPASDDRG